MFYITMNTCKSDKIKPKKKKKTGMRLQCISWCILLILRPLKSHWLLTQNNSWNLARSLRRNK